MRPCGPAAGDVLQRDAELARQPARRRRGQREPRAAAPDPRRHRGASSRAALSWAPSAGVAAATALPSASITASTAPDVEGVAGGPAQPRDDSVRRARDDDGRLVGLDLDEVLVLAHVVALGDLPGDDLGGGDALPHVGQAELEQAHQASSAARMASSTRSTEGT